MVITFSQLKVRIPNHKTFIFREKKKSEAKPRFYCKTENGEFFHRLLKNKKIVHALPRVSEKRLRRSY
ncbi:MAG: hypothetical protein CW716_01385 [Candidatus Bathyarchaeum sp.]|nr:MAG: hypothetical protein CW716_01385 [Candidatus Bathyarchaeum sp.]